MFGKGSTAREVGKAFAISFAATFGSMAGLVTFGIVAEKYLDRRSTEKTTPKIFQIDKTLPGKDEPEDDTGVVTKD